MTVHQHCSENLKVSTFAFRCTVGLLFALINPWKLGGYFMCRQV